MANTTNESVIYNQGRNGIFKPVYDSLLIALAFFIIAINVLVVYLFLRKDYLRTKTNSFLVSLAFSDLLTGIVAIPFYLYCSLTLKPAVSYSVLYASYYFRKSRRSSNEANWLFRLVFTFNGSSNFHSLL